MNNLLHYDDIIPDSIWEKCFNNMSNPDDTDNVTIFSLIFSIIIIIY